MFLPIFGEDKGADSLIIELEKANNDSNREALLNKLCWRFFESDHDRAKSYAHQQLEIARKLDSKKIFIRAYDNLGYLFLSNGEYKQALEFLIKGLTLKEEMQDNEGIAISLAGIGNIYYHNNNYNKCLEYWEKCLEIQKELNDLSGIGKTINNLALVHTQLGDYKKALSYHKLSLEQDKQTGDIEGQAVSLSNIGEIYSWMGDDNKALSYYLMAYNLLIDNNLPPYSQLLNDIADTYAKQEQYDKGLDFANRALQAARKVKDKNEVKSTYEALSKIYFMQGNYKMAYENHELYSDMKDSLLTEESSRQMTEMETKYRTEKKEKQIQVQKLELKQNRILKYAMTGGLLMLVLLSFVIYNRYRVKKKANARLGAAYNLIEEKNIAITDSIEYAKTLQEAILPDKNEIRKALPRYFIYFQPKDIVSGDFYWFYKKEEKIVIAAADCTGHGVPGAFVSMMCNNLLNHAIIEQGILDPGEILTEVNKGVTFAFRQEGALARASDGMDVALCVIDKQKNKIEYAGAQRPLLQIRDGQMEEIKPDKAPIGGRVDTMYEFSTRTLEIKEGDRFYMFSDGYADQFGGPKGKKFMIKRLKEMLLEISNKPFDEQRSHIHQVLTDWQGTTERVDDILVMGFEV